MNKKTTYVAQAGMIAAVYAAATLITLLALQGLAWGPVQFRISEAVCVLAVLTPAAVPGGEVWAMYTAQLDRMEGRGTREPRLLSFNI